MLRQDRYFDPQPDQKALAMQLYSQVREMPIISPHGHVDPALFSQADYHFPNPSELLFQNDHYLLRMLHSQGVSFDVLLSKEDPFRAWEAFASHFHFFRSTPSGMWLVHELEMVFEITETLNAKTAESTYQRINERLSSSDFTPRHLFQKFNVEVLATTDAAEDPLNHHQAIRESGWKGRVIPTFRPDGVIDMRIPDWSKRVEALHRAAGVGMSNFPVFLTAIETRREVFRRLGATAIDLGVISPRTHQLADAQAERIYQSAISGEVSHTDADAFTAHMLYEMARMSTEDGMVMQLHPGVFRNHSPQIFNRFGADMGFDIPVRTEFTRSLHPILSDFGHHPNFRLILFTLDESTYTRELAPLAGAYPSVKLGPPWWFLDSWNGIRRYFEAVIETAGIYNTTGFNNDTRAFLSIPVRHDVWRRASANWVAGLLVRGMIGETDAEVMMADLAYGLAKDAYLL